MSPVSKPTYNDVTMVINHEQIGELSQKLYDILTGIQYGVLDDKNNWRVKVC